MVQAEFGVQGGRLTGPRPMRPHQSAQRPPVVGDFTQRAQILRTRRLRVPVVLGPPRREQRPVDHREPPGRLGPQRP
jgi:hypothetical protein